MSQCFSISSRKKATLVGTIGFLGMAALQGCTTLESSFKTAFESKGSVHSGHSGECLASDRGHNALYDAPDKSSKIKVKELASLDLGKEAPALDGRRLRIRTITIEPGGYVLVHSHDLRPALAMVTEGELYEHVNYCKVPILFRKGDIIRENKGITHWVINKGKTRAVLTVSDIPDDRKIKGAFK